MKTFTFVIISFLVLITALANSIITKKQLQYSDFAVFSIFLEGPKSNTPMKTPALSAPTLGLLKSRAESYINNNWLDNRAIWKALNLPLNEQEKWCKRGGGNFTISYYFSKTPQQQYTFTKYSQVSCHCSDKMVLD